MNFSFKKEIALRQFPFKKERKDDQKKKLIFSNFDSIF
jgi:hypothetical protein